MQKTGLALCCALVAALFAAVPCASAQANDAAMKRGEMLYKNRGCRQCHGIGKTMIGPDLAGLEQRRPKEWIKRWLKETDEMLGSDSTAIGMLNEYRGWRMPKITLSDQDIENILAYIKSQEQILSTKSTWMK